MRLTATLLLSLSCFSLQAEIPLPQQLETLWQQGAYAEAKNLLAPKVTKKTKDVFLLAALGRTELALGEAEAATDWLERAIKLDGSNAEYQFYYANASCNTAQKVNMLSALGHAKRCVKAYETAHTLAPTEAKYLQALAQYYAQAPGVAGGDKAKAKTLAEQLTTMNPLKGQLLQLELLLREDLARAEAMLAESELLQQRPEAYFLIGVEQAAKRDYQAAIRQFQLASEQQAADRDAQRSRLLALYQLGRAAVLAKTATGQGINALQQFITESQGQLPEFQEWAQFRLAQLYLANEQRPDAEALLRPLQASTKDDNLKTEIKKVL
jgi:tetratricopeptide (TPR) repeat protein